ncbi:MAG: hypothetical protein IJ688_01815 [Treponema sp.]|nr:hypothetical protein [Treponema sp.]
MDKEKFIAQAIISMLLILCCLSCTCFPKTERITCNNLFLVYMAGDNSLNKTVYSDFEEIKQGLNSENDIILLLADRYTSNFYEDGWDEARLYQISYENEEVNVIELEDNNIGVSLEWLDDSIDTGSETTLKLFLQYAKNHYDSKKLYLDLWNHGGGWKSGDSYTGVVRNSSRNICFDEDSNNSLSLKELSYAIKSSCIGHFDIILMDACFMASVEVAAEMIGLTDTVIFSQDSIPEDGMPYNNIIPILFSDKSIDEKCIQICDSYSKNYEKQKTTISAFRIDENYSMQKFLHKFEEYMESFSGLKAISESRSYYYDFLSDVVDIEILFDDALEREYKNILIKNCSEFSTGMSIYFPDFLTYSKDSWEYTSNRLRFLELCPSYISFLSKMQDINSAYLNIDTYEPNNYQIDAYIVNQPENQIVSYLWCSNDDDWYVFKKDGNKENAVNQFKLISPEFLEYNLQLVLYKAGNLIDAVFEDEKNEIDISAYDYDEVYVKVYSTFGYYSQEIPYTLQWEFQ